MAKLVSEARPHPVKQPILNEDAPPSGGVVASGFLIIALLALGAIFIVASAFR